MNKKPISRRQLVSMIGLSLAAAVVAACGSLPAGPAQAPASATASTSSVPTVAPAATAASASVAGPRTIRIAMPNTFYYLNLSHAIENIAKNPRGVGGFAIKIDEIQMIQGGATQTSADFEAHYAAQVAAGAFEDSLMFGDNVTFARLGQQGLLRDLGPLLQKQAWFKPEDFWGNGLQAGQVGGKQVGLPLVASAEVVVYNRNRLKQSNVAEPPTDWTWDQLIGVAKSLTGDGKWGFRVTDWSPSVFSLAWQNGAQVIDAKGKLLVTEPGTIKALEFLDNLAHTLGLSGPLDPMDLKLGSDSPFTILDSVPTGEGGSPRPFIASLVTGTSAMVANQSRLKFGSTWWENINARTSPNLGVAALPRGDHPAALGAMWVILGVPAKPANVDLALDSLRLVFDAEALGEVMPARKPLPDLRALDPQISQRSAKVLGASIEVARFLPGDVDLPTLELVAKELVLPVVQGKKRPQDAAADAQKAIDAAMAK